MKYSKELKLYAVKQLKKGIVISKPPSIKYKWWRKMIKRWERIYNELGEIGLDHNKPPLTYQQKILCIRRIESGESITSVAISLGRECDQISRWYKIYRQYGIDGLKSLNKGRIKKMNKPSNNKNKSELEKLREENEYLKAENEYLKKLRALIQEEEKDRPPNRK